jgi:aspartate-semialdehyde dehydrogenase
MSQSCDSRSTGVRIAIVGATSPDGSKVRERLAGFGIPGSRVDLYGSSRGDSVISEYGGEARLVQDPDPGESADHDIIFLCETGEAAENAATGAAANSLVIDVVGALGGKNRPPLVHMGINPEEARERRGRIAVPHPAALLLAELLEPLERMLGLKRAVALLLRPAADFGDAGIEELRQQTVKLLSFADVPMAVFGRQLAFNIIPQAALEDDSQTLSSKVSGDVARLLRWPRNLLTLRALVVPVFLGHCLQLNVRLGKPASLAMVRDALGGGRFSYSAREEEGTTPLDVSGEMTTNLYEIGEDGVDGFWLMAMVGDMGERRAEQALRIADSAFGL